MKLQHLKIKNNMWSYDTTHIKHSTLELMNEKEKKIP